MGVVVFDYARWAKRYPEFSAVNDETAAEYFAEATLYLNNTDCSIVTDLAQRALLLNMLTAHIAQLYRVKAGALASPLVGRVNAATQGSVSVGAESGAPGTAAWFQQTPYGFSYWQATTSFRQGRYVPGRARWGIFQPLPFLR